CSPTSSFLLLTFFWHCHPERSRRIAFYRKRGSLSLTFIILLRYFLIQPWLTIKDMTMMKLRSLVLAALLTLPLASFAQVGISVNIAPPPLPVVEQPPA